jgi:hypothetical protein
MVLAPPKGYSHNMMKLNFLVHIGATLFMMGAIWIVQVVHYPLFNRVGRAEFAAYEIDHNNLITLIVGPVMIIEALTALYLLAERPSSIPALMPVLGLVLVGVVWFSTMFLQVPQHSILSMGFNENAYRFLVDSNWLRTLAWSARGLLVLWMLALVID